MQNKSTWWAMGTLGAVAVIAMAYDAATSKPKVGAEKIPKVGGRNQITMVSPRQLALRVAANLEQMGTSRFMARARTGKSPGNLVHADKAGNPYIDVASAGADVAREIIFRSSPTLHGVEVDESELPNAGVRFTWKKVV